MTAGAAPCTRPDEAALAIRMRRFYQVLQVMPRLAALIAFRAFVRPDPVLNLKAPGKGLGHHELVGGHRIHVHVGGEGPAVLLVHGWEASVGAVRVLFDALAVRGFRVVAFDLPGHGQSSGKETVITTVSEVIRKLAIRHGPFVGAVGHSFGGLALAHAVCTGLSVHSLVLMASPASFVGMMDRFTAARALGPTARRRFHRLVAKRLAPFDIDSDFEATTALSSCQIPVLLVHDRGDTVVSGSEAEALTAAIPGSRLQWTNGCGHNAIAYQRDVVRSSIDFLKAHAAWAPSATD